jgi:hypothetical protein
MIEVRNNFSKGLDWDTGYYQLPPNAYVDANNITLDAIERNADKVVSNIIGNRIFSYTYSSSGDNTTIGAIANPVRNTVIAFVYNTDDYHSILEYDFTNRSVTKVFENLTDSNSVDILGFTLSGKITGVNIYNREEGDLLFFVDSLGRPTVMNITLFKAGTYTPVSRTIIDVAKTPPPAPPDCVYQNDTGTVSNYLQKKLFRFKTRFVLDDNFKTTYSPISVVPLPSNILDPVQNNILTNNNVISISADSGDKDVKGIEIAVSIQNNSNIFGRFQTVIYIDKAAESIADNTTFNYLFYNNSTYPIVADSESLPLFDYVPLLATTQEMPNGNYLAYAGITEGYDRDLTPNVVNTINTVAAGSGSVVGSLNGVVTILVDNGLLQVFNIAFSGIPAVGTVINVMVQQVSGGATFLAATYTTIAGDTPASVATAINASFNSLGQIDTASVIGGTTVTVAANSIGNPKRIFFSLTITPPSSSATTNSIATWPFWGQREISIAYYDQHGVTNGILYSAQIVFPGYAENGSQQVLIPYINTKIYHVPPDWAYSYQICFTKDPTEFLYIETIDVNTSESDFLYFEITNLALNAEKNPTTAAVVSWTFQDGDRMRLIRNMVTNAVFGTAYDSGIEGILVSPTINNITQTGKTFVKIRKAAPFAAVTYTDKFFIIQLYRPSLQEPTGDNATFYECGVEYPIIDPTLSTRVHGGQVTNQSTDYVTPAEINIYSGDVYFRIRDEVLGQTGIGQFFVQDRNFVDFFISAVSNIDGRPQAIDLNARQAFYGAMIRYSESYQPNTNVNQLNKFLAANFLDCDYSYGNIMRLKVRDRFMRIFQKLKVGVIYLFSKVAKSQAGDNVTVVTDNLLNPVQYYIGDWGIGDNSTSLASFNYADYITSNITGGIYRVSNDGVTPISVLYKMNSWATENLPLRSGDYKVYGAYDQKLNNYIISLEAAPLSSSMIITFQLKYTIGLFVNKFVFSLGQTPNVGDTVNVSLTDGDGVNKVYSYTALSTDTLSTIVSALNSLINADIYFTSVVQSVIATTGLAISQVTSTDPDAYTGTVTIDYGEAALSPASTLTFSEEENIFESFLSLQPEMMVTIGTLFCAFSEGQMWTHDSTTYNSFFGVSYGSDITPVFNDKVYVTKQPQSLDERSSVVWTVPQIETSVMSYGVIPQQSTLVSQEFQTREGKFVASFKRDSNSYGGKINGNFLKANWLKLKFQVSSAPELTTMSMVTVYFVESNLNQR